MTVQEWASARRRKGLTQVQAAAALGITQPYLSQLEKGARLPGPELARKAAELYGVVTALPLPNHPDGKAVDPDCLQNELAALGYPPFSHVPSGQKRNPAEVLFSAVLQRDLDTRLVEALPWVIAAYPDLDWQWLRDHVKLRNAQNRLGYLVHLAKHVSSTNEHHSEKFSVWEEELEEARLAREDTLCRDSMPARERSWLKSHRSAAAEHWNLLTGLTPDQLPYAAH